LFGPCRPQRHPAGARFDRELTGGPGPQNLPGNGFPLAALAVTRELASAFGAQEYL
jgi:hypothetical protein